MGGGGGEGRGGGPGGVGQFTGISCHKKPEQIDSRKQLYFSIEDELSKQKQVGQRLDQTSFPRQVVDVLGLWAGGGGGVLQLLAADRSPRLEGLNAVRYVGVVGRARKSAREAF